MIAAAFPDRTLAEAWAAYMFHLRASGHKATYLRTIRTAFGSFIRFLETDDVPLLSALKPDLVRRFAVEQLASLAGSTVRQRLIVLKAFAAWLAGEEWLADSPLKRVQLPKARSMATPLLTSDDVQELLRAVARTRTSWNRQRNTAIVMFMVATGVRVSEAAGLRWSNVHLEAGRAEVVGKRDKKRLVTFDSTTAAHLAAWREIQAGRGLAAATVFGLAAAGIRDMLSVNSRRAGMRHVAPHQLRVTFATSFLKGHPGAIGHLGNLLGHESIEQSLRYARISDADTALPGPDVVDVLRLRGHQDERNGGDERLIAALLTATRPMNRYELAALTGLTPGTVSAKLSAMKGQGLVMNGRHGDWRPTPLLRSREQDRTARQAPLPRELVIRIRCEPDKAPSVTPAELLHLIVGWGYQAECLA